MPEIKISPSMLASDFSCLKEELEKCAKAGSDLIHLDVMDGHFVPNITIGAPVIKSMKSVCTVPFDVHLMISEPLQYISDFAEAGADIITFHAESNSDINETIRLIHSCGCRAGLAVKPKTPVEQIIPYLEKLEMVLVMTVEPGFGGQSFMGDMMPKVEKIRGICKERSLDTDIQVDGGINGQTAKIAAAAGANVLVAGSAVFKSTDAKAAVEALRAGAAEVYC